VECSPALSAVAWLYITEFADVSRSAVITAKIVPG